ncbi:DNA/RNA non-specific endonuclease [Cysteiniphilum marinum]|uniref:DNA/RNA non-specific endonuclease n=2 Tax=Cysteiniphilum marinum TaxID=2774191 RepID=UPI001CE23B98|nr:DNA/RNA non-specific endonuclease [Cysteiniphilum marinum]
MKYGIPASTNTYDIAKTDQYLCRDGYIVGYSYTTKQPVWVAYHLTGKSVDNSIKRHDDFRPDPAVPIRYQSQLSDYKNSGYDRGHLAPYAAMDFNAKSASQSFLLSNMSPQKPELNRIGWAQLEKDVRSWANLYKSIWVIDGPVFKKGKVHKTIGNNKVAVPDYFFKVIYAPEKIQGAKVIAFIMPNARVNKKDIAKYRVSLKEVQERSGLKLLEKLPESERNQMVNTVSNMWPTHFRKKRH